MCLRNHKDLYFASCELSVMIWTQIWNKHFNDKLLSASENQMLKSSDWFKRVYFWISDERHEKKKLFSDMFYFVVDYHLSTQTFEHILNIVEQIWSKELIKTIENKFIFPNTVCVKDGHRLWEVKQMPKTAFFLTASREHVQKILYCNCMYCSEYKFDIYNSWGVKY